MIRIVIRLKIRCEHGIRYPSRHAFQFKPVDEETVCTITDMLQSKLSCSIDDISVKVLKTIKTEIYKPITLIINEMLSSGIFPDKFKLAKVIPLHKKDDNTILDNYRPISVSPTISNIFERVIFNQLHDHFNSNQLYYSTQYGFRKQHST